MRDAKLSVLIGVRDIELNVVSHDDGWHYYFKDPGRVSYASGPYLTRRAAYTDAKMVGKNLYGARMPAWAAVLKGCQQ